MIDTTKKNDDTLIYFITISIIVIYVVINGSKLEELLFFIFIAFIIQFYKWCDNIYRQDRAFSFKKNGEYQKIKNIHILKNTPETIWLYYYTNAKLNGLTFRLTPTRNTTKKQIHTYDAEIKELKLKWDDRDNVFYGSEQHELIRVNSNKTTSEWICKFHEPIERNKKLPIGIEIMVESKEPWSGYLSIESLPDRKYGRLKVNINR